MTVEDVINAIETFALPELEMLLEGIAPGLPVGFLDTAIRRLTAEAEARTEVDTMRAGFQANEAAIDALEAEALKTPAKP